MKYKVGDKVRIKSLDWYNQNKDEFDQVKCGGYIFPYPMTKHCGKTVTITCVNTKDCYYVISEDDGYRSWTDEMIEGIVDIADIEPQDKMVSLNKVCGMLYAMLTTQDINDYDYVTAPVYDNVEDFVEDFRKSMEK